jgi:magnesium-transporting ATPase (P-type)
MTIINILLSIPVTFYLSIALFFASIVFQLKLASAQDSYAEGISEPAQGSVKKREMMAAASLAGIIGFGLLIIYFSWSLMGDWRASRGIFYPEGRISADNLPMDMSDRIPPAPAALEGSK